MHRHWHLLRMSIPGVSGNRLLCPNKITVHFQDITMFHAKTVKGCVFEFYLGFIGVL
jgi:hypothetical protein